MINVIKKLVVWQPCWFVWRNWFWNENR